MPDLLFELGCEELPASFVRKAYIDLQQEVLRRLDQAGIAHYGSHAMGTPRRLIVFVEGLADTQPDSQREQRGPSIKAAYDEQGAPTPALQGFCRGQKCEPRDLRRTGDYVWLDQHVAGKSTAIILSDLLPVAVRSLNFEKSMRWGRARMRFARPIRWILALFGTDVIPFEIEGVSSGAQSKGHRFYRPESFEVHSFTHLLEELERRKVQPRPEAREETIRSEAKRMTTGVPDLSDALVEENTFLTEWPAAIEGEFRAEFLDLPDSVLITAMAKHERFFPVRGENGELINRFISIQNSGEADTVREGNSWVLNARFNDAKFFFDEDLKYSIDEFLQRTERMSFQEKLGTVRQRADRLSELAFLVARATQADEQEAADARQAGLYAKADLSTGLVSEMPALQGIIGGEYARREQFPDSVCWAIASHYDLSKIPLPSSHRERTAVRLLIADQLDKLAGYLGLGLLPSGSSDPFGLRRAVTYLVEAGWSWPGRPIAYGALFEQAAHLYGHLLPHGDGDSLDELVKLFASRYEALMPEIRPDVLQAALRGNAPLNELNPAGVRLKIEVLLRLSEDVDFIQTATRPLNIVAAARRKGVQFAHAAPLETLETLRLESNEGDALREAVKDISQPLWEAEQGQSADAIVGCLKLLEAPINVFFDSTMVMVEEAEVQQARLTLLQGVCEALLTAGDFAQLVIEGES